MALPTKITKINSSENLDTFRNGGKGSGNFGHSGRPGEVGGSAPAGSSSASEESGKRKQLTGPAKTKEEYVYAEASEQAKDDYCDVCLKMMEHTDFVIDDESFVEGANKTDYERVSDRFSDLADHDLSGISQRDLVEGMKRVKKDYMVPYGLDDRSVAADKVDSFIKTYDFDGGVDKGKKEYDRLMDAAARAWDRK